MAGQIGYLTIAMLNLSYPIFSQFKIRADIDTVGFYDVYDALLTAISGGTNYVKIADLIMDYGAMSIWGAAFITQTLSLFGIATDINMMVWDYGVMYGLFYITFTYVVMQLLSLFKHYGITDGVN